MFLYDSFNVYYKFKFFMAYETLNSQLIDMKPTPLNYVNDSYLTLLTSM